VNGSTTIDRCFSPAGAAAFEAAGAGAFVATLPGRLAVGTGWHNYLCAADLGLQQFDAAIVEGSSAIEGGFRIFLPHTFLAAAYALKGDMEKAKAALAEARRLNPKLSVKSMAERYANVPSITEGLRKAGLAEE
jgi:hypothetical protein